LDGRDDFVIPAKSLPPQSQVGAGIQGRGAVSRPRDMVVSRRIQEPTLVPAKERITCECGGVLTRPIPETCPHCGARIVAVKRRMWPRILPLVMVALMFAALIAFVCWLASNL
jgi:hypothetical protein